MWFFSQARVALALMLLKTRPSGVSAPQYAQNLASRLRSLNEGWKVEARELQREVLRLRQQLLLSKAATRASSSECPPGCPGGCQGFTRSQQRKRPQSEDDSNMSRFSQVKRVKGTSRMRQTPSLVKCPRK